MAINIKNSQEQMLDDIPKIISTTSLMETHNPAVVISVSSKKRRKKRAKNMAMNNNAIPIDDQLDDSLEASNKVGHCEVATNDSPKNLLEKVLSVEPLAELRKTDAGFTENLSEGNANIKIEDKVQSMDPKLTLITSLMDLHNPAGDISMSSKKRRRRTKKKAINNNGPQIEDQVDDNLKVPNKIGDSEVPNHESQKNLLEAVLTPQPQGEHPKINGGLTANLAIVNNNAIRIEDQLDDSLEASNKVRHCEVVTYDSPKNLCEKVLSVEPLSKHRKMDAGFAENLSEGNANTKIEDEVQSMDPKITLTSSLMDSHNPAGDISMSSKKKRRRAKKKATNNNGPQIEDQVDDNLKAPNKIGDCEVPNYESQKNLLDTVLTPQPLVEHPKMDGGLTANLSVVNVTTKIEDEVQSMGPKIILNASLMETPNPAGYNSLRSKKDTGNQVDDNMEVSNKTGDCEVAHNDSQKNLLETVLTVQPLADHKNLLETVSTVQPLAEHPKIDGGLNLPEGSANSEKRKWQKRIKKKTEIKDDVQSIDPKIISSTSLMETHNFSGDNSVSIKKNSNDQVVDNLEASKKVGDFEVAKNDSQKNLFETGLTVQPLAEHPKMDGGLPEKNLSEGNVKRKKRKKRKKIKKKTGIQDEVLSMDLKILLNSSLTETQNPSGDNSLSSEKNIRDQADDNMEASNRTEYYEVAHNDSLKNVLETVLTVQPLADHKNLLETVSTVQPPAEHPKIDGGLTENLPEGNANRKKREWQKRVKKKIEIEDDVQIMDPKIISSTSLMETHNFSGDNSVSIKKNSNDQVVDNLEASKKVGDFEVAKNDSQKNLFETGLTVQPLAEHPKMDGGLPENLSEGNVKRKKRKKRKKIKKKTGIQDEVLSMDLKILLNSSLTERQNPSDDNSLSSEKNTRDQADDNMEASNRTEYYEVANNDSQKNVLETVLTVQPLAEHPKMDGGLPENLSEGHANIKKRKWQKRIKKKTEIKDEIPSVDPKIILNASPMEMQNPAGYNSLSSKKNAGNQVDDNLEASNRPGDLEVAHNDSQKNLLETVLTIQPLAEPPKVDSALTADLPEGSANSKKRKRRKRIKRKTETKDEVQSMDPKIILSTSLMETQNPAGDNSLISKRNNGDHVNDNLEASNKIGDCEVAHNDSQKILLETVSTEQPLAEHPKMDEWLTSNLSEGNASSRKRRRRKIKKKTEIEDGVQSMGQEEAVLSVRVDVSSNRASSELLDERSGSLVRPVELEMKMSPCESQQRPPSDQRAGENGKFENESNEVNFENIVVEETTSLCSFDVMKAECLPKDLDQFPNTASITASRKKLLVLDVNGLLAHIVMPAPKDCRGDVHILGRAIFKRPFCDDFLKFCFQNFDVGIWSSRTKKIIDRVVDYLLGDLTEKLLFCWDMSHSTQTGFKTLENTHKPLVCKELRKIWENDDPNFPWKKGDYDESNTLLLDDSPYKALLNPVHTAIFPPSYQYTDKIDNSIGPGGDIRVYLEGLLESGNVREYVEHHPFGQSAINETNVSWEFYSRVLHTMSNTMGNNHPIPMPTLS